MRVVGKRRDTCSCKKDHESLIVSSSKQQHNTRVFLLQYLPILVTRHYPVTLNTTSSCNLLGVSGQTQLVDALP